MKTKIANLFPTDKLLHLLLGLYLYMILSIFITDLYALIITTIIGVLIEVYDRISKKGTPELADALMVFLGAFSVYMYSNINY